MKKLKFSAAFCIAMLLLQGLYAQYTGQVNYSLTDVSLSQSNGYDVATIEGCQMEIEQGKPFLPVSYLSIAPRSRACPHAWLSRKTTIFSP